MFGAVGKPSFLDPRSSGSLASFPARVEQACKMFPRCLPEVVLAHLKPVQIPLQRSPDCLCVLYADEFVTVTGTRRPANQWLTEALPLPLLQANDNRWRGLISSPSGPRVSFRSRVPHKVLAGLATFINLQSLHVLAGNVSSSSGHSLYSTSSSHALDMFSRQHRSRACSTHKLFQGRAVHESIGMFLVTDRHTLTVFHFTECPRRRTALTECPEMMERSQTATASKKHSSTSTLSTTGFAQ